MVRLTETIAADTMQCAIGTVRSRIHRARVMLRKHLESGGARVRTRKSGSDRLALSQRGSRRTLPALVAA